MNYSEQKPLGMAASFVKLYWQLSHGCDEIVGEPEPVLPDGCVELIFDFQDRFITYHSNQESELQPRSVVAGQLTSPLIIGPSGNTDIFGVRLRTEAGFSVLGLPMAEIRDRIIDMKDVLGNRESELFECLAGAVRLQDRIDGFERFVFRNVDIRLESNVSACVNLIKHTGGAVPITKCLSPIGLSARMIERAFNQQIGVSPKTFARIVRFQSFINSTAYSGASLLDLALSAGYFDQAHLIKDFRSLAGTTPTDYFARHRGFSDNFLDR